MNRTTQNILAGLGLLIFLIMIPLVIPPPSGTAPEGLPPTTSLPISLSTLPIPTTSATSITTTDPSSASSLVRGQIVEVDTRDLALGRTSFAYVTLTNTGMLPITKVRIEITAGRDFGFPLGYQSQQMIHELDEVIEPGDTRTLADQFDLPLNEGIIPLEGLYEVSMRIYANDNYLIGSWQGEVYLRG